MSRGVMNSPSHHALARIFNAPHETATDYSRRREAAVLILT